MDPARPRSPATPEDSRHMAHRKLMKTAAVQQSRSFEGFVDEKTTELQGT